jgi:hypothetical protein
MNNFTVVLCILAHLNHTIKNEQFESIGHLHLLHKYREPGSQVSWRKFLFPLVDRFVGFRAHARRFFRIGPGPMSSSGFRTIGFGAHASLRSSFRFSTAREPVLAGSQGASFLPVPILGLKSYRRSMSRDTDSAPVPASSAKSPAHAPGLAPLICFARAARFCSVSFPSSVAVGLDLS